MNVYVFGHPDIEEDNTALKVAARLKNEPGLEFVFVPPNADLPFAGLPSAVLLDTVAGLNEITLINETQLDKLVLPKSLTVHDYDLAFQLKYLLKLGQLHRVTIIGLPQTGEIDYLLVQSILRKLVAQEIHGS